MKKINIHEIPIHFNLFRPANFSLSYALSKRSMRRSRAKIISYLRVGYLLHIITFISLLLFCCLFSFFDIPSWLAGHNSFIKSMALSPTIGLPLFAQLDARSRYQNYKLVKDNLYTYGFKTRFLKPFIKSSCQRAAVKVAAVELGMLHQCREYFKRNGYKWYHLIPDIVLKKPSVLFTKNFWSTTLFTKTYHPRIDFEKNKFFAESNKLTLVN